MPMSPEEKMFQALSTSKEYNAIPAEELKRIGRTAAQAYLKDGTPLTTAVVDAIGDRLLTRDQTDRVVEAANSTTFTTLFDAEPSAKDRVIDFPIAKADDVLDALRHTSNEDEKKPSEGWDDPVAPAVKLASDFSALDEAFRVEPKPDYPDAHPNRDVYALRDRLDTMLGVLKEKAASATSVQRDAFDSFREDVKQAALEGATVKDIASLLSCTGDEPENIAALTEEVVEDLTGEGVSVKLGSAPAGRFPNPQHPMVASFSKLASARKELGALESAMDEVEGERAKVEQYLHELHGGKEKQAIAGLIAPAMGVVNAINTIGSVVGGAQAAKGAAKRVGQAASTGAQLGKGAY